MLHDLVSFGTRNIMAQFPFRLSLFLSLLLSSALCLRVFLSLAGWLAGCRSHRSLPRIHMWMKLLSGSCRHPEQLAQKLSCP